MKQISIYAACIGIFMLMSCSSSMRFSSKVIHSSGNSVGMSGSHANTLKYQSSMRFSNESTTNNIGSDSVTSNSIILRGIASYYGNEFQGRMTSNGEIYNRENFTAAHRSIPFGTLLLVKNLRNNLSVVVRVNDRGPFKSERILDLSYAAAEELDMLRDGVTEVKITVIE
jgi:rare lipoprotein A